MGTFQDVPCAKPIKIYTLATGLTLLFELQTPRPALNWRKTLLAVLLERALDFKISRLDAFTHSRLFS